MNDELTKTPVKNHKRYALFHITILPAITYQWAEELMDCNKNDT